MKSTPENKFRCCSHCYQTLPIEEFYIVNKRTGKRDAYCKTCRRLMNRLRQHPDEQPAPEARPRTPDAAHPPGLQRGARERHAQADADARRGGVRN